MSVLTEQVDGIFIITINRPEARNAMDGETRESLRAAFNKFEAGSDRVAIITGAGDKAFCAGMDLKEMASKQIDVPPRDFIPIMGDGIRVTKPTIAAVNGVAYAGGWLLAQMCDLCVAAENARFAITEAKVGRGMPWAAPLFDMLPRRIALELLMTGEPIDAQRAYEVGFVNKIAPIGQARAVAIELARKIVSCAPLTVKAAKALAEVRAEHKLSDALNAAYALFEPVYRSADAIEGPRAFAEKRTPRWTG